MVGLYASVSSYSLIPRHQSSSVSIICIPRGKGLNRTPRRSQRIMSRKGPMQTKCGAMLVGSMRSGGPFKPNQMPQIQTLRVLVLIAVMPSHWGEAELSAIAPEAVRSNILVQAQGKGAVLTGLVYSRPEPAGWLQAVLYICCSKGLVSQWWCWALVHQCVNCIHAPCCVCTTAATRHWQGLTLMIIQARAVVHGRLCHHRLDQVNSSEYAVSMGTAVLIPN